MQIGRGYPVPVYRANQMNQFSSRASSSASSPAALYCWRSLTVMSSQRVGGLALWLIPSYIKISAVR